MYMGSAPGICARDYGVYAVLPRFIGELVSPENVADVVVSAGAICLPEIETGAPNGGSVRIVYVSR